MSIDLGALANDIVAAHKMRKEDIAGIRKETDEILRQADEMLEERRSEIFKVKKEIAGMLGGFRKELGMLRKERKIEAAAWHDIISKIRTKGKKETAHGRRKKSEKPAE
ncbi:MAG: hypothetical protein HZB21_01090 [Deltaproteobacteria bacterium]|nr:hypothetical protein [Deltaproteobacteria bacterium]MBI5809776.1 hypothetical protein [Deltaproteobacteria bacterium]